MHVSALCRREARVAGFLKRLHRLFGRTFGWPADRSPGASPRPRGAILLIGLEQRQCGTLAWRLEGRGFQVSLVSGEEAGREALEQEGPALVVVCGPASLDFYRLLRRMTSAPILALDAQAREEQVLAALASGVDQFQARPVSEDEAVARVLALLRRAT